MTLNPRVLYAVSTRLSSFGASCPTSTVPVTPLLLTVPAELTPVETPAFAVVVVVTVVVATVVTTFTFDFFVYFSSIFFTTVVLVTTEALEV